MKSANYYAFNVLYYYYFFFFSYKSYKAFFVKKRMNTFKVKHVYMLKCTVLTSKEDLHSGDTQNFLKTLLIKLFKY